MKKNLAVAVPMSPGPVEVPTTHAPTATLSALAAASSSGITSGNAPLIDAAASAFLGKNVHVVSVKLVGDSQPQSRSWVDHGLSLVHGSHNIVQRGR